MNLLPLVNRELQVALRRPWTLSLRKWSGAGTMSIVIWALLVWGDSPGAVGENLFRVLTIIAALACFCAGIFLASDTLSREKREGTLGFLFLTDLFAPDIVLGKIAAAGIVPASILLAIFPGLAVCQLAGGVSGGEFWRVCFGLLMVLMFVLAAAVLVSSRCQSHHRAYLVTTAFLVLINPYWICWLGLDTYYYKIFLPLGGFHLPLYWLALLFFLLLTPVLVLAACIQVDSGWRDKTSRPEEEQRVRSRRFFIHAVLDREPIVWLMLRRTVENRKLDFIISSAVCLAFLLILPWAFKSQAQAQFLLILFVLNICAQAAVLARTAYSFYKDRQDGSLELLLGTRIVIEEVFFGFNRYLLRQTQPLLCLISILDISASICFALASEWELAAIPLAMAATLWIAVFGFGWLGVYRSLMTNHPLSAMLATFSRICLFPLAASILFLFAPRTNILKVMFFWTASSAFIAAFFAIDAKHALSTHGRTLLLRGYGEKPPHIENELSFINWDELE